MNIAIYTHKDCLAHDPGQSHPESPDRLRVVLERLKSGTLEGLEFLEAPEGNDDQVLLAHSLQHLAHVRESVPATGNAALDGDTVMSPASLGAALRCVGGACKGVDDLATGRCQLAFCATRPPGHHATRGHAMGFCIFNHIAIAALHARVHDGISKVAIVDFDVHHGNGTQDIILGREGILYISTHQSPLYPGSGQPGENVPGHIINFPLPSGTDGDVYRPLFETKVLPQLEDFAPDLLLVSAGFDAHLKDPLASLGLVEEDYRWIGQQLKNLAQRHCGGRILSVLEGGYNLDVLGPSVEAYLEGLS